MNTDDKRLEELAREAADKWYGDHLIPPNLKLPLGNFILAALHKAVEPYRKREQELREIIEVLKASHSDFNTACVQLNEENQALIKQEQQSRLDYIRLHNETVTLREQWDKMKAITLMQSREYVAEIEALRKQVEELKAENKRLKSACQNKPDMV